MFAYCSRGEKLSHFFIIVKLLKLMVARDGIELPTPAFSGRLGYPRDRSSQGNAQSEAPLVRSWLRRCAWRGRDLCMADWCSRSAQCQDFGAGVPEAARQSDLRP